MNTDIFKKLLKIPCEDDDLLYTPELFDEITISGGLLFSMNDSDIKNNNWDIVFMRKVLIRISYDDIVVMSPSKMLKTVSEIFNFLKEMLHDGKKDYKYVYGYAKKCTLHNIHGIFFSIDKYFVDKYKWNNNNEYNILIDETKIVISITK